MSVAAPIAAVEVAPFDRPARFFFAPEWRGQGVRVVLLVGSGWRRLNILALGLDPKPLYEREALDSEPDRHANGQRFGWVYKPDDAPKDEERLVGFAAAKRLESAIRARQAEMTAHHLRAQQEQAALRAGIQSLSPAAIGMPLAASASP